MEEHATALADAIEAALPAWVQRCVTRLAPHLDEEARAAGMVAQREVGREVRALLALDVDDQRTTPLSVLRSAVRYPAAVLREAGVAPVERDAESRRLFPDDDYDLTPATFADIDESVQGPGIAWGAAKAWTHKARHSA